jgi:tetratricopeptide (TPR) repeat protein
MLSTNSWYARAIAIAFLCVAGLSPAQDSKDKYQPDIPAGDVKQLAVARSERTSGHTDQAIKSLDTLIRKSPDYYSAQYNLGLAYLDAKQNDKAIEALERALAIKKKNSTISDATIFNSLGWAYMVKGDAINAETAFKNGETEINGLPDESKRRLYTNMGWLYMNTGRLDQAEKYLKLVDERYDSPFAKENLKIINSVRAQQKEK